MKKQFFVFYQLVFISFFLFLGCTVIDNSLSSKDSITSVTLKYEAADAGESITKNVGDTFTLTADVIVIGSVTNTVTWTTSDESVATVSQAGEVVIVGAGAVTITATSTVDPTKKDSVNIINPTSIIGKLLYNNALKISVVRGSGASTVEPTWTNHIETQTVEYSSVKLPDGVTLDSITGIISLSEEFTSTVFPRKNYRITATGIDDYTGTISISFGIEVIFPPITGSFSYPGNIIDAVLGITATGTPNWKGREETNQSVTYKFYGAAKPGLTLNTNTGEITVLLTQEHIKINAEDTDREWELDEATPVFVQAFGVGEYSGNKNGSLYVRVRPKTQITGTFRYNSEILAGYTASLLPLWENNDQKQTLTGYSITEGTLPDGVTFETNTGKLNIDIEKTKGRTMPHDPFTISISGTGKYEGTISTEVIISFMDMNSEIATIKDGKRGLPDYTKLHFDKLRFLPDNPADMTEADRSWFMSTNMWKVELSGITDEFSEEVRNNLETSMNALRYIVFTRWFRNSVFSIFAYDVYSSKRYNAAFYDIGSTNYTAETHDVNMTEVYMTIRNISYSFVLAAKCIQLTSCATATANVGVRAEYKHLNIETNFNPNENGGSYDGSYIQYPIIWSGLSAGLILHEMTHNMGYSHFYEKDYPNRFADYKKTYRYQLASNNELPRVTFPDGIPNYLANVEDPLLYDVSDGIQLSLFKGKADQKLNTYYESVKNGDIPKYYNFSKVPINNNINSKYD